MNTTNTKFEKPESYWQELSQFRNQNKEECVSNKQANFDGSTSTFFDTDSREMNGENQANGITDDDGRNHKCIHSFTLNERLFPVPIYKGKNGQSACPVCKSTRKDATIYSPQFFKISIPKSRILQPYKIQPNKRSDKKASDDTLSLAEVCLVKIEFIYLILSKFKLFFSIVLLVIKMHPKKALIFIICLKLKQLT